MPESEIKSMVVVNPMSNHNKDSYSYLESYRAKQRASLAAAQAAQTISQYGKALKAHPGEPMEILKYDYNSIDQDIGGTHKLSNEKISPLKANDNSPLYDGARISSNRRKKEERKTLVKDKRYPATMENNFFASSTPDKQHRTTRNT